MKAATVSHWTSEYTNLITDSQVSVYTSVSKELRTAAKWCRNRWPKHAALTQRSAKHQVSARLEGGGPRVVVSTAAFHARVWGSVPGLGGLKETKMFLPHPRVKVSIVGSLRDREVACSASDRQGLNFESCVWRTVSSQSSHHPQEVLLAQFSLYVHKGGLKLPDVGVSKKQNVFSPLTRKDLILWGASVTERIVCLKSVILFYSPFSGGSPGPA